MGAYNIVNPANLVAGQLENVGDVMANLQAIQAIINGGIDNSNINAAAAIAASKLAGYPSSIGQVLAGDGTWKTVPKITTSTFAAGPPGGPVDGDIWIATNVGGTSGPRWTFGYNSGSPLADKWEFLGGSAYWINGTTAPPNTGVVTTLLSFTTPRGGVYLIGGGFFGSVGAAGAGNFATGVGINSVLQSTTGQVTSPASTFVTVHGLPWVLTIAATQTINFMGSATQTITGVNESMSILPVRVS
jgi:hypothetical protein